MAAPKETSLDRKALGEVKEAVAMLNRLHGHYDSWTVFQLAQAADLLGAKLVTAARLSRLVGLGLLGSDAEVSACSGLGFVSPATKVWTIN